MSSRGHLSPGAQRSADVSKHPALICGQRAALRGNLANPISHQPENSGQSVFLLLFFSHCVCATNIDLPFPVSGGCRGGNLFNSVSKGSAELLLEEYV